ncbi:hypothetical protein ACS0TY_035775 [Phlomoides rotata]
MEKLINLRWLELDGNKLSVEDAKTICKLYKLQFLRFYVREVPREIENFVHLTLLDLSFNDSLEELPESICNLLELRTLNIKFCRKLSKLPQGIQKLENLEHLPNLGTSCLKQFPEGLAEMTKLRTLNEYSGGVGWSKLGWLEGLDQLSGFLSLKIRLVGDRGLGEELLEEAYLKEKARIRDLQIIFEDETDKNEEMHQRVLHSLKPHAFLEKLTIWFFKGSNLPDWIGSHLRTLTSIKLYSFNCLSALPPLGELPCLEDIYISEMHGLQCVGPNFLGITAGGDKHHIASSFPKLKELAFNHCPKWKEWEDIAEEDEAVSIMRNLKKLTIVGCPRLNALPHRLLRKLHYSVKLNVISCSTKLQNSYGDPAWISTSRQNPH